MRLMSVVLQIHMAIVQHRMAVAIQESYLAFRSLVFILWAHRLMEINANEKNW